jgi:hypothetical protein
MESGEKLIRSSFILPPEWWLRTPDVLTNSLRTSTVRKLIKEELIHLDRYEDETTSIWEMTPLGRRIAAQREDKTLGKKRTARLIPEEFTVLCPDCEEGIHSPESGRVYWTVHELPPVGAVIECNLCGAQVKIPKGRRG